VSGLDSDAELRLAEIDYESRGSEAGEGLRQVGAEFADLFRKFLPDVDDVTIGRVLWLLGDWTQECLDDGDVPAEAETEVRTMLARIQFAVLDLTAIERGLTWPERGNS
jgi:hypothetical protein